MSWTDTLPLMTPENFTTFLATRTTWGNASKYHCWNACKKRLSVLFGEYHPLKDFRIRREVSPPPNVLTSEQVRQLIGSIDTTTRSGKRDLPLVLLMLDTGMRAGEVTGAELKRLDLDGCKLTVLGKGGKWRDVVFSERTRTFVEAWLVERIGFALPNVNTVFVSVGGLKPGTSLTPDGLRSIFRYLSNRSGIKVHPHTLRHTWATLAIKSGAPTRVVQIAGGWSNLNMVERYTRSISPEDMNGYFPVEKLGDASSTTRLPELDMPHIKRGKPATGVEPVTHRNRVEGFDFPESDEE